MKYQFVLFSIFACATSSVVANVACTGEYCNEVTCEDYFIRKGKAPEEFCAQEENAGFAALNSTECSVKGQCNSKECCLAEEPCLGKFCEEMTCQDYFARKNKEGNGKTADVVCIDAVGEGSTPAPPTDACSAKGDCSYKDCCKLDQRIEKTCGDYFVRKEDGGKSSAQVCQEKGKAPSSTDKTCNAELAEAGCKVGECCEEVETNCGDYYARKQDQEGKTSTEVCGEKDKFPSSSSKTCNKKFEIAGCTITECCEEYDYGFA